MARLLADENFPLPVVIELRQLGHDVLTIYEAGKANQSFPDDAVLELASQDRRAILTINRKHFIRLHKEQQEHAGIIVCTFDPDFEGQAKRIDSALGLIADIAKELVRINRPGG